MRKDTSCLDVRFTFQGSPHSPPIEAHQVILISSAPQLFEEIFTGQTKSQISGRQHELFEKVSWPKAQSGHSCNNNSKNMVEIHVCDKVARQEFVRLLEFLYMGASIADLQKTDSIYELLAIAKTFNLTQLLEACENVLEGNEMENSVKSSFVGGGRATVLRDMFFDKPLLDDLVFQIQGSLIYAHQVVVIARCRVLAEKIAKFKQDYPGSVRVKVRNRPVINLQNLIAVNHYTIYSLYTKTSIIILFNRKGTWLSDVVTPNHYTFTENYFALKKNNKK